MRVYLDTCILIYRAEGARLFSEAVAEAVRTNLSAVFCITDLVRLECLVGPIRHGNAELRRLYEEQFQALERLPHDRAVFDVAAEVRAHTRLKVPDALHAAAAITHGCAELWTNDHRFDRLGQRLKVRVVLP